jgi:hypothetical protein
VSGRGCAGFDGEAELLGEGTDELDGGWVGGVAGAVLGAGEALFATGVCGLQGLFAPDDDRHSDFGGWRRGLFADGICDGSFLAAGQYGAALCGETRGGFFWRHEESSKDEEIVRGPGEKGCQL